MLRSIRKKVRVRRRTIADLSAGFAAEPPRSAKRTVSLLLNGKSLQTKTVDVPDNGRAQVEFLGLDAPYGFSRGEVRIDAADTLPADDHFPFAVERTDPRKVLFVDDGRAATRALFYRAALDASPRRRVSDGSGAPGTGRQSALLALRVRRALDDLGTLPGGFEDALQAIRQRAADRC